MTTGTIYLHYPCFDGIVSATIAEDYVRAARGWNNVEYHSVNYGQRNDWLSTSLSNHSVVVDFLYHCDAEIWADHHATTFLTAGAHEHFERHQDDRTLLYDRESRSCAMLLWQHLGDRLSNEEHYRELAYWADRIDSADYPSVEDAVLAPQPATAISLTLGAGGDDEYRNLLLRNFRTRPLEDVAELPEVRARIKDVRARVQAGLSLVRDTIRMEPGGIAVFELEQPEGMMISRYAPYIFFPDARYSVALVRSGRHAKITAMRNPWRDFESVELGTLFTAYGGGGHRRVASVVLQPEPNNDPRQTLSRITSDIRSLDNGITSSVETRAS